MLGLGLGFSSSITLRPPTFGRSKHHLDLVQRASPNVINCSNFSTDSDAFKKVDLKLRKVVKEEIKSCVAKKPRVPNDFPFEVEDIPKRSCLWLKWNRRDEREKFNVLAFLPEDLNIVDKDKEHHDYGKPLQFIILRAYICKEDGEKLIIFWVAHPDPYLCFPYKIFVNGVKLKKEDREHFDWRGTLQARGVDDCILAEFTTDYMKFRYYRKRRHTLKKLDKFIKFKFQAKDADIDYLVGEMPIG